MRISLSGRSQHLRRCAAANGSGIIARMCLIAFAWNAHPAYPLVLAANRDEFHARPTAALAEWDDAPGIIGGRDLRERGGWLAVDRHRPRLAAVTNVRELPSDAPRLSRGSLVREYLAGSDCAVAFAELRRVDGDSYGPFNLLLWDGDELIVATNRLKPRWETVARGIHGISNGALDAPWPKTQRLKAAVEAWLAAIPAGHDPGARSKPFSEPFAEPLAELDIEPLLAALADQQRPADADLPDTGVGIERERLLSSAFIRLPGYGTRASQVVLIGRDGGMRFVERRFGENGTQIGAEDLCFPPASQRG